MDEKAKGELNLKSQNATIAKVKQQIESINCFCRFNFDMYQKTDATIEGDVDNLKLRLDNNMTLLEMNLTAKNAKFSQLF
jgi:hypothetical protein